MRVLLLLALLLLPLPAQDSEAADLRRAYTEQLAACADGDPANLMRLALWCRQYGLIAEGRAAAERIIAKQADHAEARAHLGYERVQGKWLRDAELAEAKGLVRWLGGWVTPQQRTERQARQERVRALARQRTAWASAWQTDTRYFRLRSNAPARTVEECGRQLDAFMDCAVGLFAPAKPVPRITVELFATQEEFRREAAAAGFAASADTLGHFWQKGDAQGIRCWYAGNLRTTLDTIFHECTHLLVELCFGSEVPSWANEGMAVFLESAGRDDGRMEWRSIPWAQLWHLQAQLKGGAVSLDALVAAQGEYPAEAYPQGWGLIHYLLNGQGGRFRQPLLSLYRNKKAGREPLAAFRTAFGAMPKDLFADFARTYGALEPKTRDELCTAAVAAARTWADGPRAQRYAEAALKLGPSDPVVLTARARAHAAFGLIQRSPSLCATAEADFAAADAQTRLRGKRTWQQSLIQIERGLARWCAGDTDAAIDIAEGILAEDDLHAGAYLLLALAAGTAEDERRRDAEAAAACLAIADDLGRSHENDFVRAMLLATAGKRAEAAALLRQAAKRDPYGFGAFHYTAEAERLAPTPAETPKKGEKPKAEKPQKPKKP